MEFKIVWSEPAIAHLAETVRYVAHDDPAAALRVGQDILQSVKVLEHFPFIGPAYKPRQDPRVRFIVARNHRIFYRVQEPLQLVEVLAVWHGSRDEPPDIA